MQKKGDVLLCVVGATIGKTNLGIDCAIGRSVAALRPNQKILSSEFLFYYLRNNMNTIRKKQQGSAQGVITKKIINNFLIPIIPIKKQNKIISILKISINLTRKKKRIVELVNELIHTNFVNTFEREEKIEKWKIKKLKDISEIQRRNISSQQIKNGTNYIGLENIEKETGKIINYKKVKNGELKSNKFFFTKNNILYGKLRPYLNKVALPDFDGVCSTDIIPIIPKQGITTKNYLTFLLRGKSFLRYANDKTTGANLPRIGVSDIEKFQVRLPPYELQKEFSSFVKHCLEYSVKQQINVYSELTTTLTTKLLPR